VCCSFYALHMVYMGNTKYRKGLQRTSRKTTKDYCRTAKDLEEDRTGPQGN